MGPRHYGKYLSHLNEFVGFGRIDPIQLWTKISSLGSVKGLLCQLVIWRLHIQYEINGHDEIILAVHITDFSQMASNIYNINFNRPIWPYPDMHACIRGPP